jgi:predicted CxxxxCH...CXXCH cytochrome family protein
VNLGFTISTPNNHANGIKDVAFGNNSVGGTYNDPAVNQCNNLYCHSNAQPVGGTNQFAPPTWDTTFGGARCNSCHSGEGEGSPTWSVPHTEHLNVYAGRFTCQACHDLTAISNTALATPKTEHVDNTKDIKANAAFDTGAFNYNLTQHTCQGVTCHSTGDRFDNGETFQFADWDEGTKDCTYCHEGADTRANMTAAPIQNRMSVTHIRHVGNATGVNEYGDPARGARAITCNMCHKGTTDDGQSINAGGLVANHVDGSKDVVFDVSDINTAGGENWLAGSSTCQSVYCHGANTPFDSNSGSVNGTGMNPQWTDTAYFTGTLSNDCGKCHGFPPNDYAAGPTTHDSAGGGAQTEKCAGCHTHLDTDGTFNDITKHIDGITQAISCGGCHAIPPIDAPGMVSEPGKGQTGRTTDYAGTAWGEHDLHANDNPYGFGCEVCHTGGQPTAGQHNDAGTSYITMGFNIFGTEGGNYNAPQPSGANYGLQVNAPTVLDDVGETSRLCSAIYCHSDGGDYGGAFDNKTVNWDDPDGLNCNECHGNPAGSSTDRKDLVVTNAHPTHVDTTALSGYALNCDECHDATVDASQPVPNITGTAFHVNDIKNVVFSTAGRNPAGGSYSRPQCTTTYCHSDGVNATGVQVPEWNNAATADCGDCHGANNVTAPASTPHGTHVLSASGYQFACVRCHTGIVTDTATRVL